MKIRELIEQGKSVERRMYGNVMAIMAILAGIFTLVNVNAQAMQADLKTVLTLNLTTVGSFSVLVALIGVVTDNVKGGAKDPSALPASSRRYALSLPLLVPNCCRRYVESL